MHRASRLIENPSGDGSPPMPDGGVVDGLQTPIQSSTPVHQNEATTPNDVRSINVDAPHVPSGRKLSEKEQRECAVIGEYFIRFIFNA